MRPAGPIFFFPRKTVYSSLLAECCLVAQLYVWWGRGDLTSEVKGEEPRGSLLSVLFTAVLTGEVSCSSEVSPFPVLSITELTKMAD